MYSNILAIFAGLLTLTAAAPSGVTKEPCAQLSQVYQQQLHKHPNTTASVSGELVHKCMQSIPFDSKRATAFIPELKKYLQFQSTTETLKDPPPGYLGAPVDLFGGLDHISQLAADNKYTNQNDFDNDIYNLLASAHDGHLYVKGLCSHQSFLYNISMPVISVSKDGLQLPEIYSANDAALLGSNSHRVSPVVSVNGQEAVSFFKDQASKQNSQDPDARYNSVFKTFARSGLNSSAIEGMMEQSYVWPGQSKYTFEFGNGTVHDVETKAVPLQKKMDFNFPNGKALFNKLCIPENKASSSASPTPSSSSLRSTPTPSSSQLPRQPAPTMLPKPVMREPKNYISGYYLHEKGLGDVAVLLVPTFKALGAESLSFSKHAAKFIKQAAADGKKKLVIDVTGNPGGSVYAGYDLFKLLFPDKPIYAASRFRTHEAMDLLGQSLETITDEKYLAQLNGLAVPAAVTPNQTYNFQSWPELYGPQRKLGTNVSSLYTSNFSIISTESTPIHGYGDFKTNQTAPPFKPEDILIVTDGYCASTCTVFSENLKWQGVKSLAFGGRPQYGPMQAIGGVKGAQAAEMSTLKGYETYASAIQQSSAEDDDPVLSTEQMKRYNETAPGLKTPSLPISDAGVNLLNQYGPDDDSVPLQFVYEPADCRLFYTLENINEPATIWSTAARTYWGKGKCVPGSNKESTSSTTVSVSLSLSLSSATPSAIPSSSALF